MATHLDLEEQEQLDQLKAFWKQYGNLITWGLTLVLAAFAAWNGWNWWQRDQAVKAAAMFDELEKAASAGEVTKAAGIFNDMKERFPRTAFTQQGGLMAAKVQFEKGQADAAVATLGWVAGNAGETEYQTVARLRLAGVLADQKKYDEALEATRRRDRQGVRGAGGRPPRRHPARAGQDGRGQGRLQEGLGRDGCEGRVPTPDRRQAHLAGRARRRPKQPKTAGAAK